MSTSVTFNGTSYTVPAVGDANWGANVSAYLIAISTGCLQKTGGSFTLSTADVDFGSSYGLKTLYYKSKTANIAAAGVVRLAKTDTVSFRNNANAADLPLGIDGSDNLIFNSIVIATSTGTQTFTNKLLSDSTVKFCNVSDATKLLMTSLGGATTGTTMTLISSHTGARSLTLPDATDTLIGKATTDTLTNKILSDSTSKFGNISDVTKTLLMSLGGATTGKAMTIVSSHTNNRSLTLPDTTDTLAGKATTDVFTNKTLSDSTCVFGNVSDNTKQALFSLGGATTAKILTLISSHTNNRSITFPDATDTLVGKATTDTLTNKTLTSPTVTGMSSTAIALLALRDTSAAFDLTFTATSSTALTAGRTLTIDMVNTSKTIKIPALSNFSTLSDGSSGQALTTLGTNTGYAWTSVATNPMTTLGDLMYGGASGAVTRLAGDTSNTKKFLSETSSAGTAAAPTWATIAAADVPAATVSTAGTITKEGTTTATLTFTQAGGYSQAVTGTFSRHGNVVFVSIPFFTGTATATAPIASGATDVPANYRPASLTATLALVTSSATSVTGQVEVTTAGKINIYGGLTNSNFATGLAAGLSSSNDYTTFFYIGA